MELDHRRLYLGQGCASMFVYCTQLLHLAEGAAHNQYEARLVFGKSDCRELVVRWAD
ncbi:MAG: hypothetical protein ABIS06_07915 [Vicinamibacterales bacterium]